MILLSVELHIMNSNEINELSESVVKKIMELGKILKNKNEYLKWIKFLNRTILMIKRYIKLNQLVLNKKTFF